MAQAAGPWKSSVEVAGEVVADGVGSGGCSVAEPSWLREWPVAIVLASVGFVVAIALACLAMLVPFQPQPFAN